MKTLFIDTHGEVLTVGLLINDKLNKVEIESVNGHASVCLPTIDSILKEEGIETKDLDRVVVVNGPGSFTGIRIGLSIAKTIGYALGIPTYPVSSLDAYLVSSDINDDKMCVIPDSKGYYECVWDKDNNVVLKSQYMDDISNLKYKRVENKLDIKKICEYVQNDKVINVNLISANYVKKIGVGND